MGVTGTSRCETPAELRTAVERLLTYGPVLVEEYLPGDEYTVGIVGGNVIGVMQVVVRFFAVPASGHTIAGCRAVASRNSRRPTAKMPPERRISSSLGVNGTGS